MSGNSDLAEAWKQTRREDQKSMYSTRRMRSNPDNKTADMPKCLLHYASQRRNLWKVSKGNWKYKFNLFAPALSSLLFVLRSYIWIHAVKLIREAIHVKQN